MQDTEKAILTYGQLSDLVERIEQIPPLSGEGAPTTLTPAFHLGQRYINTTTGDEYYCSNIDYESDESSLPTFEWKPVDTSASYTGGDGIDISAQNVISATNTGKAKVLTTADYNANSSNWSDTDPANFNCVALWKLPPGIYSWPFSFGTSGSKEFLPRVYITNGYLSEYSGLVITGYSSVDGTTGAPTNMQILDVSLPGNVVRLYTVTISTGSASSAWNGRNMLTSLNVVDSLTSDSSQDVLSARQGKALNNKIEGRIIQNAGAPTTATVGTVGKILEDTTNGKLYICTAVTPGTAPDPTTYTWEEVGGGSGFTKLTSADYNFPEGGTATTVALWKLQPGLYEWDTGTYVRAYTADGSEVYSGIAAVSAINNGSMFICRGSSDGSMFAGEVFTTGGVDYGGKVITDGNVKQTTGTSTTNVMSQNAVTNAISAIGAGTRKATSTGWDTSAPLNYILQPSGSPTHAQGAMFYTGKTLGDFPIYAGIGIYSADTNREPLPYLLTQTTSDDGQGTTSGDPTAYRIALHSEIPATFTTNEWNALWA